MIKPVQVEALPMGEPAFDSLEDEIIGEGFSYEFAGEVAAAPLSEAPIAILWLPTPGGPHREYCIYRPEAVAPPEPQRRPLGFRKRGAHA